MPIMISLYFATLASADFAATFDLDHAGFTRQRGGVQNSHFQPRHQFHSLIRVNHLNNSFQQWHNYVKAQSPRRKRPNRYITIDNTNRPHLSSPPECPKMSDLSSVIPHKMGWSNGSPKCGSPLLGVCGARTCNATRSTDATTPKLCFFFVSAASHVCFLCLYSATVLFKTQ